MGRGPDNLSKSLLYRKKLLCYTNFNFISNQTVDAEITVIMLTQRARDAENWVENKSSNGPLRVQGTGSKTLV
jgi:hypothetical protein